MGFSPSFSICNDFMQMTQGGREGRRGKSYSSLPQALCACVRSSPEQCLPGIDGAVSCAVTCAAPHTHEIALAVRSQMPIRENVKYRYGQGSSSRVQPFISISMF